MGIKGITPARQVDSLTVIRRVYFDLTGLPPTAEEVHTFLADSSPDASDKLIHRLLASPHYGERWGRHWLDVPCYGDHWARHWLDVRRYAARGATATG